ncbi:metal sensitive transcriptional repressor [Desulfovibrio sp. X2]|uniref:metal-sensitive transcriptional regulator n=1 Tax=Desulfovibrio sp. X2 TaxID=941449 RepID=UPI000358C762|nr:metal-sensitive transcriptional regulator [Desulfovibrio sp. X2]EPR37652.1 metal sensitive transcriptional repressor [Desulfovibrio sp. X2]
MTHDTTGIDELQKNVLSRLRKVEGQIRGIQNMVQEGKECEDILIQVRAVRSALKSTTALMLKRYVTACYQKMQEHPDPAEAQRKMEKTIQLLTNFLDG